MILFGLTKLRKLVAKLDESYDNNCSHGRNK
jgi:hypothetical protein